MEPGGFEAVGDAVTGGLIGRSLEPGAGEAAGGAHGAACLNCGAELVGPHCHQCGQPAHVHRSLMAFWHDLAHGVLHFEGKIWRTLPLLAWRPGELTRRYVEGQRARFVSPIALFLFSVFLMFAVFNAVGGPIMTSDQAKEVKASQPVPETWQGKLDALGKARAATVAAGRSPAALDLSISVVKAQMAQAGGRKGPMGQKGIISIGGLDESSWLGHALKKAQENPQLLAYKLQTNAYKYSWALIPISVPFVWLMFLHRRRYRRYRAYDHTVFVTYSLSFMTLMVVFFSLLHALFLSNDMAVMGITFVPPFHMYRQLRGAYALSRFSALWRTGVLAVFAMIAMTLFMLLLLALGVSH